METTVILHLCWFAIVLKCTLSHRDDYMSICKMIGDSFVLPCMSCAHTHNSNNIHVNNNEKKGVQFQSTKIVWALTKSTYIRTSLYMNVISSEKERGKPGGKKASSRYCAASTNGRDRTPRVWSTLEGIHRVDSVSRDNLCKSASMSRRPGHV